MQISETKESIKSRLHKEAARQWGVDEIDLKNGSFDPLVDLLFGAFATETEKIWQEIESSQSHTVKRMAEAVLPETITGIVPAHSVLMVKTNSGPIDIIRSDQFTTQGNNQITMSPAGSFRLSGATVRFIATGARIDRIGSTFQRETAFRITGKPIEQQTCWVALEIPEKEVPDQITLFFNWTAIADQSKNLSYIPLIRFSNSSPGTFTDPVLHYGLLDGVTTIETVENKEEFFKPIEESVRESYNAHFMTVTGLKAGSELENHPKEWTGIIPESNVKTLFPNKLLWIKMRCPASITPEALDKMEVFTNCIPVLNRKLVHQRGRLQPLFNVYGLKDDEGFMTIDKVVNGDGETLLSSEKNKFANGQNVYALRNRGVARFDKRDAFQSLNDVTAKMRDDLAAFNALDISTVSNHLDKINQSVSKLKEHLETFDFALPQVYIMVKTRSVGTILDVYFWTSEGEKANGLRALTKLNAAPSNRFKTEASFLMLPTTGGRAPMNDVQMQKALKETLLTRGRAVTLEDYRTMAQNYLGDTASKVEVKKGLGIGEGQKEGLRFALDVLIFPNKEDQNDEYWMRQARLVKNNLSQKSVGMMPLYVSVHGFNWKM
ncbi:hypothetical protein MUK70_15545 [Dyadobacter chenwenxiniae]|uniref:Baseplate J-like protein n=1 Tax=Dyadobacter chenwenxiniae TaxID=2906456 RepID=A0A9X1TDR1_9BACT|nr:hypothetical protein [Dyadobacter chenwenxiniae]MCF0060655.1 hypothetical protein [Dyadobacter chenwenxiniae]UON80489.1 hypothetical protein MUK70_15545 [Dyadobacter chenwenxiniae]